MKIRKKVLLALAAALLVLLLVLVGYVIYVFASYHRIDDNQPLEVAPPSQLSEETLVVEPEATYSIMTYNVGFGAYTPEYSFFMDGGKYSWAFSKESAAEAISGAAALLNSYDPDFIFLEEVDLDATRSYHLNQKALFDDAFPTYYSVCAIDYDSPFLFWPLNQPHGKSLSSLVTYSRYPIVSSLRRSLPISSSLSKLIDLDRCYSVSRVPVSNGKELVLFCAHLSAYGTDAAVRDGQLEMLAQDMQAEVEKGNYVICGGDFNHDLLAEDTGEECESWAYPFDRSKLGDHISLAVDLLTSEERDTLTPSCRNADMPYQEGVTYVLTVDGFLLSDNIQMVTYENESTGFAFSDHDPVRMEFQLKQ